MDVLHALLVKAMILISSLLKELFPNHIGPLGELTSWGNFRTSEQAGYQITLLACNFEKMSLDLQLAFNQEGKISGFHFFPAAPAEEYEYMPLNFKS